MDRGFKHESMQDAQTIAQYLKALEEGFAKGEIVFETKGKAFALHPKGLLRFDVEAKKKSDRCKVIIKLTWKDEPDQPVADEPLAIR